MRIAVVHDDPEIAGLCSYLLADTGHETIWTATDGKSAIENCIQDLPDLILLKLTLSDLTCSEVVKKIMADTPTTIIIVSESIKNNPAKVFEAMSAGALDAVTEPKTDNPDSIKEMKRKIKNINNLHKSIKTTQTKKPDKKIEKGLPLIAIGSSTGGPAALVKILSKLPKGLHSAIVIIQHMDIQFTEGMVDWINKQTGLKIEIAKPKQKPKPGIIYVAGTNDHLVLLKDSSFAYTVEPEKYPYRPSVDVFFESALTHWPNEIIGVLHTGMGRDGASGLLSLYNRGMLTIAQDQKSCAVFGMPKAAAEMNAASKILPIEKIADAIIDAVNKVEP